MFAGRAFGRADSQAIGQAAFVLWDAPQAAVKPYVERREPPPTWVDAMVGRTYRAIVAKDAP